MNGMRFFDKIHENRGVGYRIYINVDSNKIDLLLDKVSSQSAVEIKAGKTVQPDFFKNYLPSSHLLAFKNASTQGEISSFSRLAG